MFRSHFFRQLYIPFVVIICLVALFIGLLGAYHLDKAHVEQARRLLRDTVVVVSDLLSATSSSGNEQTLRDQVNQLSARLGYRITVIDAQGKVLADSQGDPQSMASHRLRPEVMMAVNSGEGWDIRQSETIHHSLLYYATRTRLHGEIAYIRLAVELEQLQASLRSFYIALALAVIACSLLAAFAAYLLARRQVLPIVEVTAFADQLAGGRFDHRIPQKGSGELSVLVRSLNSMADALKRLINDARKGEVELQAILESMDEGVIATQASGTILLANEAAARLLQFDIKSAISKAAWEVIRHEQIIKAVDEVLRSRHRRQLPGLLYAGKQLDVTICPFAHASSDSKSSGLVIVVHDVTQAMRYQELRKEFVANVSHELRTPLSVISGYVETLRDGAINDTAKRDQYLQIIERHADQLANLVNDLLEISRLESGQITPRKTTVDLNAVLRRAIDLLRPAADAKAHVVEVHLCEPAPFVLGSEENLERAAVNLIDNAIKYTPANGHIDISLSCDSASVFIKIKDSGIGIPQEDVERIFERFYRVDRSRSREMGGTGLGLAIVKHIVQTHGGHVNVESKLNAGSEFSVVLPIAPARSL